MQILLLDSLIEGTSEDYYKMIKSFETATSDYTDYKILSKEKGSLLLEEIFVKIFSTNQEDLKRIQKIQSNSKFYSFISNSNLEERKDIENLKTFIGPVLNTYSITKRMHEYTHIKIFLANINSDINYSEFIPTIIENITAYYISKKYGKKELDNYKNDKIKELKEVSKTLKTYISVFKEYKIEDLPKEIQISIKNLNNKFISYIFSNRMFELFKEDPAILDDIRDILNKESTVDEIIDEYDLNPDNYWTMNATYKLLGPGKNWNEN